MDESGAHNTCSFKSLQLERGPNSHLIQIPECKDQICNGLTELWLSLIQKPGPYFSAFLTMQQHICRRKYCCKNYLSGLGDPDCSLCPLSEVVTGRLVSSLSWLVSTSWLGAASYRPTSQPGHGAPAIMTLSDFTLTLSRVTTPEEKIISGFLILFCHIWLEVSWQGEENRYLCFETEQTWMGRSFKIDMFQILCDLHNNIMQPARTHRADV